MRAIIHIGRHKREIEHRQRWERYNGRLVGEIIEAGDEIASKMPADETKTLPPSVPEGR